MILVAQCDKLMYRSRTAIKQLVRRSSRCRRQKTPFSKGNEVAYALILALSLLKAFQLPLLAILKSLIHAVVCAGFVCISPII